MNERANERMNVWMDSPCSIAMKCPCLSACVHVFDWVFSLLFLLLLLLMLSIVSLVFREFSFLFSLFARLSSGPCESAKHAHTQNHIYTKWMHTWPHTLIHKFTFSLFSGNTWKHSEFLCDSFAVSMFLFSFCFFGVQERLKRPTRRKRIEKRLSVENMCATGK